MAHVIYLSSVHLFVEVPSAVADLVDDDGAHEEGVRIKEGVCADNEVVFLAAVLMHVSYHPDKHLIKGHAAESGAYELVTKGMLGGRLHPDYITTFFFEKQGFRIRAKT